ncbi:Tigger transposable element-derived protein 6 [Frankliniella fusca]|uniref:Tigger transposable element-derived protein 6 n=1 Tax=Frankliniella fusca TaxID=407009 RepID=A0AAE1LLR5_9NEOP|nr:Tigger transposable element-derived protein 6 [Frankliniella fusca]
MPPKPRLKGVTRPSKRSVITLDFKLSLIRKVDAEPQRKKTDIARELGIPVTTLYTILKSRAVVEAAAVTGSKSRKRVRAAKYDAVENSLIEWIRQARSQKIPLDGPIICAQAKVIALRKNLDNFRASNGWLHRFRKRNNVLFRTVSGESAEVDQATVRTWKTTILPPMIRGYAKKDVFNADEFGLFFNVLPDKSMVLSTEDCHGKKGSKARITVLLACNADGSEKLAPLTIGKSKQPRPFRTVRSLPCDYTSQPKAWMTGDIMISWLKKLDGKMRAQRRRILLFIDNCPAHPTDLNFLTNITVHFFPKNCTSVLQPLEGVIHNLKFYYRKRLVARLLNMIGQENLKKKDLLINILQALHYLQWAWNQVKQDTILNCFRRAGFTFDAPEVAAAARPTPAHAQAGQDAEGAAVTAPARRSARCGKPARVRRDDDGSSAEDDPDEMDVVDTDAASDADSDSETVSRAASDSETSKAASDSDVGSEDGTADSDHAGESNDGEEEDIVIEIDAEMEEQWSAATRFSGVEGASLIQYVTMDDDTLICQPLTLDNILEQEEQQQDGQHAGEQEDSGDEDEGTADTDAPQVTTQQCLDAIDSVRSYLGQLPDIAMEVFASISHLETLVLSESFKAKKQRKISDYFSKV